MPNPRARKAVIPPPSAAWVFARPHRILAFGLGSGLIRPAPGTWGTLAGWALWWLAVGRLPPAWIGVVLVLSFVLGCLACQRCGRELGAPDYGGMVWDEIVAIWLVLWWVPAEPWLQFIAVLLFRLFDVAKPPPVRNFDRRLNNGLGVMVDDILAAAYTVLAMALILKMGGL